MTGIAEMFAEFTWRRDDYQAALEVRASWLAERRRESAEMHRQKMQLSTSWREQRRLYMRDWQRGYDSKRRREDPVYLENRRRIAREATRRYYARKRGERVPLRKRGAQRVGTPHRPHHCSYCEQPGHNRRRCPEALAA